MPHEAPTPESNEKLREEFNRLRQEQDERMRQAIYIGMTADEAKEYEKVRKRLIELFERLYQLKSWP